jgi:hypothetical protein
VGALPYRRYSARTKTPQWEQEDWDRVSGATASVSPKAAAGCNPRPSIRRVTRAGSGRCCSRSSVVLERFRTTCGVGPHETWIVGDNLEWEIVAPQRLGIYAIWYDGYGVGLPRNSAIRPDRIIRRLSELLL